MRGPPHKCVCIFIGRASLCHPEYQFHPLSGQGVSLTLTLARVVVSPMGYSSWGVILTPSECHPKRCICICLFLQITLGVTLFWGFCPLWRRCSGAAYYFTQCIPNCGFPMTFKIGSHLGSFSSKFLTSRHVQEGLHSDPLCQLQAHPQ